MDIWTPKEVVLERQYEQYRPVCRGDIVVDIGASIGDFSFVWSQRAKAVYAYEMNEQRVNLMLMNIRLNNAKNVKGHLRVVRTVDDVFKENKLQRIDFLKIDCEGAEYEIFRNSDDCNLRKVRFIAMEVHLFDEQMKRSFQSLRKRLRTNHFRIREVPNQVHDYIKYIFAENVRVQVWFALNFAFQPPNLYWPTVASFSN